jgi:acetylornithine deacetylase
LTIDPLSRPALREVLEILVRTASVNPSIAPDEPYGEGAIARVARDWLAERGIRSWLEEAGPGRPNTVAEIGDKTGPTLVFCAHLDTVGTAGMTIPPFEPRLVGNRLHGRGSCDMKGSVAAIMSAAVALGRETLPGCLLVALVADEEHLSSGAEDFLRRHRADACVLTEPSDGRLILGHKGFAWIEVVTRGRAAHGSRWDLGVSAISKMGHVIAALDRFDRQELRERVHPLVGPASLHCPLVQGGTGLSTYAEKCTLQVERRTLPGETAQRALEELREVVRRTGEDAELRILFDRPPLLCDPDSLIARSVRAAATRILGRAPEEGGVAYWMDAALFAAAGIPTVNYGPSGAGMHEPDEWVDLDSVVSLAEVLAETFRQFCNCQA